MVNISLEKDGLDAELKIQVQKEDYSTEYNQGLREYGKSVSIPGFRKGKVPTGVLKKLVGEALKKEKVEKLLNTSIQEYLEKEKLPVILNPLRDKPEDFDDLDWNDDQFEFSYQLGLRPDLDLNEEDLKDTLRYVIKVDDEVINEEVEKLKREYASYDKTDKIGDGNNVFLSLSLTEVEGEDVLEGGISNVYHGESKDLPQQLLIEINSLSEGDDKIVDLSGLDMKELQKLLQVDELAAEDSDKNFKVEIKAAMKMEPAELNEDLFDKIYGEGVVTNEEEFRNKLREDLTKHFGYTSDSRLWQDLSNTIKEKLKAPLPEKFLNAWFEKVIHENQEQSNEEYNFESFEKDVHWMSIVDYLSEKYEVNVEAEEVYNTASQKILRQLIQMGMTDLNKEKLSEYTTNYLQNPSNFNNEVSLIKENKIFELLKEKISFKEKEVSFEEFQSINKDTENDQV